jgi:hypothetical protein
MKQIIASNPDGSPVSALQVADDVIGTIEKFPILVTDGAATELRGFAWQLRLRALLAGFSASDRSGSLALWSAAISSAHRMTKTFAQKAQLHVISFESDLLMVSYGFSSGEKGLGESLFTDLRASKHKVTKNAVERHFHIIKEYSWSPDAVDKNSSDMLRILEGQYRIAESELYFQKAVNTNDRRKQLDYWDTMHWCINQAIDLFRRTDQKRALAYALQRSTGMILLNGFSAKSELLTAEARSLEALNLSEAAITEAERLLNNRFSFALSAFERSAFRTSLAQVLLRLCYLEAGENPSEVSSTQKSRIKKAIEVCLEALQFTRDDPLSNRELCDILNNIGVALTLASNRNGKQAADAFGIAQAYRAQVKTGVPMIDSARAKIGMKQIEAQESYYRKLSHEERSEIVRNLRFKIEWH